MYQTTCILHLCIHQFLRHLSHHFPCAEEIMGHFVKKPVYQNASLFRFYELVFKTAPIFMQNVKKKAYEL